MDFTPFNTSLENILFYFLGALLVFLIYVCIFNKNILKWLCKKCGGQTTFLEQTFDRGPCDCHKENNIVTENKMHPYKIGESYFIRTVTFHYTGKLINVYPQELELANACWIPDDGRFSDALKTGIFKEVEPYPIEESVVIGRGAIVDAQVFNNPLPIAQK